MEHLFAEFGIYPREAQVFSRLIEVGHATANEIARVLRLPRASVYSALENLEKRGLVYKERRKRKTLYLAHRIEVLSNLIAREREEFNSKEARKVSAAKELTQLLTPLYGHSGEIVPQIALHEGAVAIESMLIERLGTWRASIALYDNTWWGYQDHVLLESYPRWFKMVEKTHKSPELVRLLSNESFTEKKLSGKIPRREIRLVPPALSFSSTIWILGDYIVTIVTRRAPHFAFEIKNTDLAGNMRSVFQMLWQVKK